MFSEVKLCVYRSRRVSLFSKEQYDCTFNICLPVTLIRSLQFSKHLAEAASLNHPSIYIDFSQNVLPLLPYLTFLLKEIGNSHTPIHNIVGITRTVKRCVDMCCTAFWVVERKNQAGANMLSKFRFYLNRFLGFNVIA